MDLSKTSMTKFDLSGTRINNNRYNIYDYIKAYKEVLKKAMEKKFQERQELLNALNDSNKTGNVSKAGAKQFLDITNELEEVHDILYFLDSIPVLEKMPEGDVTQFLHEFMVFTEKKFDPFINNLDNQALIAKNITEDLFENDLEKYITAVIKNNVQLLHLNVIDKKGNTIEYAYDEEDLDYRQGPTDEEIEAIRNGMQQLVDGMKNDQVSEDLDNHEENDEVKYDHVDVEENIDAYEEEDIPFDDVVDVDKVDKVNPKLDEKRPDMKRKFQAWALALTTAFTAVTTALTAGRIAAQAQQSKFKPLQQPPKSEEQVAEVKEDEHFREWFDEADIKESIHTENNNTKVVAGNDGKEYIVEDREDGSRIVTQVDLPKEQAMPATEEKLKVVDKEELQNKRNSDELIQKLMS